MQSEAVPSPLADLFLPGSSGERSGSSTSNSPAEADRFERYLRSARQAVSADQALPAMARDDDRAAGPRPESRREPVERRESSSAARSTRAERSRSDDRTEDRGSVEDRAVDRGDRNDRSADRSDRAREVDRARTDDGGETGATGDDERNEVEAGASSRARSDAADGEAGADRAVDGGAEVPVEIRTGSGMPVELAAADGTGPAEGSTTTVDDEGDPVETVVGEADDEAEVSDGTATTEAGSPGSGANLERAAEQVVAMTAAGERSAGDGASSESTGDGDEAIVTTLGAIDEGEAADGGEASDDRAAIDIADGPAEAEAGEGPASGEGEVDQTGAETGRAATGNRSATTEGPDVAPVVTPVANQAGRTVETSGNQVAGAEAVSGPGAARNRPAPTTTAATQGAEAPVLDGEAGDPLWLQVRRAMGSLRTLRNGEQQLTIRLRPAELGSVVVRVNAGEHGTRVSLLTDSAVAATQLGQQRQQLISELEQGGLSGVAVDISNGDDPGNPGTADPDGGERGGDGAANGAATGAAAALAGATTATVPRAGSRGRRSGGGSGGLVDVDL